jgi:hypothetical protein
VDRERRAAMKRALFAPLGAVSLAVAFALPLSCSSKQEGAAKLDRETLMDPATCKTCHADHFEEWSGSMHAYASDDPVFVAMNARGQRETNGALGDFCVKCHAPLALRAGATKDGLNLATVAPKLKGVTCFFCHTVDKVDGAHNAPLHLSDAPIMRGSFADPVSNTAHDATYSTLHDREKAESAQLCGACHDIVTPAGAAVERTFAEWEGSVFSHAGGATCGQCHMDQSTNLRPIANAPNVFARRFHGHMFAAIDVALTPFPHADDQKKKVQAFLDTTLQTALCVTQDARVRVLADNVGAGHAFPSGASQDRRLWTEVIAYRGGQVIFQSGVVAEGTPVIQPGVPLADPNLWVLRDCISDAQGQPLTQFFGAASDDSNVLPAQLTFDQTDPRYYQTHVVKSFPSGNGALAAMPDRVTLRVRLRPIGLDVLDDLIATKDLDPAIRAAMPTFDVGAEPILEWTPTSATEQYYEDRIPVMCVTKTNFNVAADKVAAPAHARTTCAP